MGRGMHTVYIVMGQKRREERVTVTKQRQERKRSKMPKLNQRKKIDDRIVRVMQRERKNERNRGGEMEQSNKRD